MTIGFAGQQTRNTRHGAEFHPPDREQNLILFNLSNQRNSKEFVPGFWISRIKKVGPMLQDLRHPYSGVMNGANFFQQFEGDPGVSSVDIQVICFALRFIVAALESGLKIPRPGSSILANLVSALHNTPSCIGKPFSNTSKPRMWRVRAKRVRMCGHWICWVR